jgi:hypothetical protein
MRQWMLAGLGLVLPFNLWAMTQDECLQSVTALRQAMDKAELEAAVEAAIAADMSQAIQDCGAQNYEAAALALQQAGLRYQQAMEAAEASAPATGDGLE